MSIHNFHQIFSLLRFSKRSHANRRSFSVGAIWRCTRALSASIHVPFIVIANIQKVMSSFQCSRKCLQSNVICPTVTSKNNHLGFLFYFSAFHQCLLRGINACSCRRSISKHAVHIWNFPSSIWINSGGHLQTTSCIGHNYWFVCCAQYMPHNCRNSTSLTSCVTC